MLSSEIENMPIFYRMRRCSAVLLLLSYVRSGKEEIE